jgi:hypothetical protein
MFIRGTYPDMHISFLVVSLSIKSKPPNRAANRVYERSVARMERVERVERVERAERVERVMVFG